MKHTYCHSCKRVTSKTVQYETCLLSQLQESNTVLSVLNITKLHDCISQQILGVITGDVGLLRGIAGLEIETNYMTVCVHTCTSGLVYNFRYPIQGLSKTLSKCFKKVSVLLKIKTMQPYN